MRAVLHVGILAAFLGLYGVGMAADVADPFAVPGSSGERVSLAEYAVLTLKGGVLQARQTHPEKVKTREVLNNVQLLECEGNGTIVREPGKFILYAGGGVLQFDDKHVTITHTLNKPGLMVQATLRQYPTGEGTGRGAALQLTTRGVDGGNNGETITLVGETFAELCLKHPVETDQYLAPMLAGIGLDGIIQTDKTQAVRRFARQMAADPAIKAQVDDILRRMDDDVFDVRTKAKTDLLAMGERAVPILMQADTSALPLETRITIRDFLKQYNVAGPDPKDDATMKDVNYLTLCMGIDDPKVPELARKQLEKVTGKKVEFDTAAKLEARRAAVLKMRLEK